MLNFIYYLHDFVGWGSSSVVVVGMERGERQNKYLNEVKNRVLSLMCVHKKHG